MRSDTMNALPLCGGSSTLTENRPNALYTGDLKGAAEQQRQDAAWPGWELEITQQAGPRCRQLPLGLQKLDLQRTA